MPQRVREGVRLGKLGSASCDSTSSDLGTRTKIRIIVKHFCPASLFIGKDFFTF